MKLVLLSGGSGKRLWPLSNQVRSKQFLQLLRSPDGEMESMVQRIWRQLDRQQLRDQVYISTVQSQADLIQSQLGSEVPLIIEPESRDTFPSVALAAVYLYTKQDVDLQEVVVFMPVDPFVQELFFTRINQLEEIVLRSGTELALIGVAPTYPSTKYGYIIPDPDQEKGSHTVSYRTVQRFQEKPSEEQAVSLIKKNALWNCGVFAFQLGYMINLLREKGLPTQYEAFIQGYAQMPKISFDYEVIEKAQRVVVLPYEGYWKDLGTWNTLTEEMEQQMVGNGFLDENSSNTHLINELELPVAVIGGSNLVVAVSADGILVSDKAKSHLVKNLTTFTDKRPMYEERRWGWYQVLHHQKTAEGEEVLTKRLHIQAGKNLSYQYHHYRSEVWVVVSGKGEFVLDGHLRMVSPGEVLEIPTGAKHGIRAIEDLDIIEVQKGSNLVEEDIVRLCQSWEEMKASLIQE